MKCKIRIDVEKTFRYSFRDKPIIVGGKAMEYYGLRNAGDDIDLIVSRYDYECLKKKGYLERQFQMDRVLDIANYEVWESIRYYDYNFYRENAIEENDYLIMSLEKLLHLKAISIEEEKSQKDLKLIANAMLKKKYKEYLNNNRYKQNALPKIKQKIAN